GVGGVEIIDRLSAVEVEVCSSLRGIKQSDEKIRNVARAVPEGLRQSFFDQCHGIGSIGIARVRMPRLSWGNHECLDESKAFRKRASTYPCGGSFRVSIRF